MTFGDYHGRKVPLDKIMWASESSKKYKVYVDFGGGEVKKILFGDPNMRIRRANLKARANFRARHRCDSDPPKKTTARYWACAVWDNKPIADLMRGAAGKGRHRFDQ
jgi:hypothetical protein